MLFRSGFTSCSTPDTLSLFLKPTDMLPCQSHFTLAFPMPGMPGERSEPPWVQAGRGCIVWREFKTIIKAIKSLSFYYHHAPTILNSVGNKILLEEAGHSHRPALDLPFYADTHVACTLAAFMSLLNFFFFFLLREAFPGHLVNILSLFQLFVSPFPFYFFSVVLNTL